MEITMSKKLLIIAIGFALIITATLADAAPSISQEAIKNKITKVPDEVWELVDRDTARFPSALSKRKTNGCATVEYTLTPTNEIKNVNVVSASRSKFAKEAQKAITKWDFKKVEGQLTQTEVTTQTRFEFCIASNAAECLAKRKSFCKGNDVIAVVLNQDKTDNMMQKPRSKLR